MVQLAIPGTAWSDTDLSLSSSVSSSPVVVNSTTYLTASISNYGADDAQDVTITSPLNPGFTLVTAITSQGVCSGTTLITCDLGTISAGNLNVQATVVLEVTPNTIGSINNDFSISSSTMDSNSANNTTSVLVEVVALINSADQSVTYDTMPDWAYQNGNTNFPIIVVNNGPAAVSDSVLTFAVTSLVLSNFVSATPSQGTCVTALTGCVGIACIAALMMPLNVSCELGALGSGGNATVDIVANMAGDVGDSLQLSASVASSSVADPDSINNQSIASMELIAQPDVEGGAGPGGCFIATAAYGSDMSEEVRLLRDFRDQYLLTNVFGQKFVSLYYQYSPPLANYIAQRESLRAIVRLLLLIPITFIQYPEVMICMVLLCLLSGFLVFFKLGNRIHGPG